MIPEQKLVDLPHTPFKIKIMCCPYLPAMPTLPALPCVIPPQGWWFHVVAITFCCRMFTWLVVMIAQLQAVALAQETMPVSAAVIVEQQLEALTESREDAATEDDVLLQSLGHFLRHPLNLNTANLHSLQELSVLSPLHIQQIIRYRSLLGNFISIYELQAVPGLDLLTIEKIRPYVTVSMPQPLFHSLVARWKGGTNTLLARASQVLEKQRGYLARSSPGSSHYPGAQQRLFVRYKYQFNNLLQYGIVGEKDAGEQFFKGAQKSGFDFYSFHLFARKIGAIQSLALGDFTVNLGQGLIQWQSLAFTKSADVTNIKRQLPVLRPYNAAGEINFHRGAGITITRGNLEATAFISFKKVDGNVGKDTVTGHNIITSFQLSGLHRTPAEVADKGAQQQFVAGGNLAWNYEGLHLGINSVQYRFSLPVQKSAEPYNLFAMSGRRWGNYSADYSVGFKNFHFFGEVAVTHHFAKAFISGVLISADANIDLGLVYRNIAKDYQSLYSNAFTESAVPNNEKGFYSSISIRPAAGWRIDAYADFFKSHWLRYLVDAPSAGSEYLVQLNYRPNKQVDCYLRYRTTTAAKNYNPNEAVVSPVMPRQRQNIRAYYSYKVNPVFTLRNRVEMVWFDKKGTGEQHGYMLYVDGVLRPMMKKYSGSVRLAYFETEGYESRLYAYENDVLYSFSIPVFYDKGYRYYINLNYDLSKKLTIWMRWAQTIYNNKERIGTGLDEIAGNKRTEVKIQARYFFN